MNAIFSSPHGTSPSIVGSTFQLAEPDYRRERSHGEVTTRRTRTFGRRLAGRRTSR